MGFGYLQEAGTPLVEETINPYDAIMDFKRYDSEESSHDSSPEHSIVYVNEQITDSFPTYDNLSIAGLKINASDEFTSLSNFSAFVKEGIAIQRLVDDNGQSVAEGALVQATNLFPEIAYELLTDT